MLATLNASIHHEMITPLQTNVSVAERLKSRLESTELLEMV